MADRKVTVLNPAGYQELFQTGDNLLIDGSVNLQTNTITGIPLPGSDNAAAANKEYVDTQDQEIKDDLDELESAVGDLEADINAIVVNDGKITFTGSEGITVTGGTSFTANQSNDITLDIKGPDVSSLMPKPTEDGDFIITNNAGTVTYNELIDLGEYS